LHANWIEIDRAMVKRRFLPFHDLDL